jgi:sulfite oxidase
MQGDVTVEEVVLPTYRRSEVYKHRRAAAGVWVTYGDGVYDITEFLKIHPGGADKVMLAAGGPLEPFW